MDDIKGNCLKKDQFGPWLRANSGRTVEGEARENKTINLSSGGEVQMPLNSDDTDRVRMISSKGKGGGDSVNLIKGGVGNGELAGEEDLNQKRREGDTLVQADPRGEEFCLCLPATSENQDSGDLIMIEHSPPTESKIDDNKKRIVGIEGRQPGEGILVNMEPLQDCTNALRLEKGAQKKVKTVKTKGQWKRQARIQGKEEPKQDQKMQVNLTDCAKKKERTVTNQCNEQMPGISESKKIRMEMQRETLKISEVEETSRNWS